MRKAATILSFILSLNLFFARPVSSAGINGDSNISGSFKGSQITIQTTDRDAGAIASLTWNGKQFVDDLDHGRQIQTAFQEDGGGENKNPTEAGSATDDTTSTSVLGSLSASGNVLTTHTQMAYWHPYNGQDVSPDYVRKRVQIGFAGISNVIEDWTTVTFAQAHSPAYIESVTGYMPGEFNVFYSYNPSTHVLTDITSKPVPWPYYPAFGSSQLPVITTTSDGQYAEGIFSADSEAMTNDFSTYVYNGFGSVSKWSSWYLKQNVSAGDYNFKNYIVIGSLADVKAGMDSLEIYFQGTPAPTLTFSASPSMINQGSSATLTWSSTNATSCTASGAWSGSKSTSENQTVSPVTTSTYNLACTGAGGSVSKSTTVTVNTQASFDFTLSNAGDKSVTASSSVTNNISATLSSGTSQAVTFSASGLPSGASASFSSGSCTPTCSTTLTINTTGSTPTGNSTITVTAIAGSLSHTTNFLLSVSSGGGGNTLPSGNFDGIVSGVIGGWSYDPDISSASNTVEIFFNGPVGTGTLVSSKPTDVLRSDVNVTYGITGNHGFQFNIPSAYKDGNSHTVYIYGIDLNDSSKSTLLNGSPKSFNISSGGGGGGGGGGGYTTPYVTPYQTPSTMTYPDGTLINDHGTIYVIEYGQKRGIISMDVFNGFGYRLSNVITADISSIPTGPVLGTAFQRHPRGTLIIEQGAVYYIGANLRYPFPSAEVFYSWGNNFKDVVPANSFDISLSTGAIVQMK